MRWFYVLMLAIPVAVGMSCSPDGEGWDYRLAIRKDMKHRYDLPCPPGEHPMDRCPDGTMGPKCLGKCERDTISCAPGLHLVIHCEEGRRGRGCHEKCNPDTISCAPGTRSMNRCADGRIEDSCPERCEQDWR